MAGVFSPPYKSISRDGGNVSRLCKNDFVRAVVERAASIIYICKDGSIKNHPTTDFLVKNKQYIFEANNSMYTHRHRKKST